VYGVCWSASKCLITCWCLDVLMCCNTAEQVHGATHTVPHCTMLNYATPRCNTLQSVATHRRTSMVQYNHIIIHPTIQHVIPHDAKYVSSHIRHNHISINRTDIPLCILHRNLAARQTCIIAFNTQLHLFKPHKYITIHTTQKHRCKSNTHHRIYYTTTSL